jgi:hypothetical protein
VLCLMQTFLCRCKRVCCNVWFPDVVLYLLLKLWWLVVSQLYGGVGWLSCHSRQRLFFFVYSVSSSIEITNSDDVVVVVVAFSFDEQDHHHKKGRNERTNERTNGPFFFWDMRKFLP